MHEPAGPPQGRIPERAARRWFSEALRIRAAAARDASAVVALVNELSREEGDRRGLFTPAAYRRATRGDPPLLRFLLAEAGGRLLGHVTWSVGFDTGENYKLAFVMDLYVRPSHRRRGIATELLRAVARRARLRARDRLCWGVLPRRKSARQFYAALGAEPDGYVPMSIPVGRLRRA
jgi:GNAT superfamily N-acetyltransferase